MATACDTITDERKAALIERYRDINVDFDDWFDYIYDHFIEDMKAKHIVAENPQFSGFWSQGDGASFTGYVSSADTKTFIEDNGLAGDFPAVMRLLEHGGTFTIMFIRGSNRHYVHENTVHADISYADNFVHVLSSDTFRDTIITAWDRELDGEYTRLAEAVTTILRDHCRDLYDRLKKEYDYLTSDEAVWEAIIANDLIEVEIEEDD